MNKTCVWTYHTGMYTVYTVEPDLSITFVTCHDCLASLEYEMRVRGLGNKHIDDLMFRLRLHRSLRNGEVTVDLTAEANSSPEPL